MKTSVLYCGHTRGPRLLPIKREINNKGKYVGIKAMEKRAKRRANRDRHSEHNDCQSVHGSYFNKIAQPAAKGENVM